MKRMRLKEYADYLKEWEKDPDSRPRSRRAASIKRRHEQVEEATTLVEASDNSAGGFNPTFSSSVYEREWILTYLGRPDGSPLIETALFMSRYRERV